MCDDVTLIRQDTPPGPTARGVPTVLHHLCVVLSVVLLAVYTHCPNTTPTADYNCATGVMRLVCGSVCPSRTFWAVCAIKALGLCSS